MPARKKNASKDGAPGQPGGAGAEVAEERVEVVTYAAAIDVAKGSGMVCTRVPGSRADRKRQTVWQVDAAYHAVIALMDHLRCQGIQRLVLESTSDYWRIWYYLAEAAGLVWLIAGRRVWRWVCCPCAGRRRDRLQGGAGRSLVSRQHWCIPGDMGGCYGP